jgi:hypothetical protein
MAAHETPRPGRVRLPGALSTLGLAAALAVAACDRVDADPEVSGSVRPDAVVAESALPLEHFLAFFDPEPAVFASVSQDVFGQWRPAYAPMVIEAAEFSDHGPALLSALEGVTGQRFGGDPRRAYRWLWQQDVPAYPAYGRFKSTLYRQIDPSFGAYFDDATDAAKIRLDEIRWGGVARDGIPPLSNPKMIAAEEASYLAADHVVFGVEVNGDARAYPKRILAWHEMFKARIGGVSLAGVYCTLCGSMVLYESEFEGTHHELGTSGFLYRSNKLMYDHATESLWSTLRGEPVVGPLVGEGIRLTPRPVVTTTWAKWRERHPATRVLSLETGHRRDYGEGVAYRDYFATDALMFDVPFEDRRLANKDEVLVLRFAPDARPTAIDVRHLAKTPLFRGRLGERDYTVLTDASGAHRVYASDGVRFASYDGSAVVVAADGGRWQLSEAGLAGPDGSRRDRLAAHRAFWFGWHAAHPDTVLLPAR